MKNFIHLLFVSLITIVISSCGSSFCEETNCGPNGTCNEETEQCDCDQFYEGTTCEKEIRERYLGNWDAVDASLPNAVLFSVAITAGLGVDEVMIQTPGLLQNYTMTGVLDAENNIDIPEFKIHISSNTYFGTIDVIDENNLMFKLNADVNGNISSSEFLLKK